MTASQPTPSLPQHREASLLTPEAAGGALRAYPRLQQPYRVRDEPNQRPPAMVLVGRDDASLAPGPGPSLQRS